MLQSLHSLKPKLKVWAVRPGVVSIKLV